MIAGGTMREWAYGRGEEEVGGTRGYERRVFEKGERLRSGERETG